MKQFNGKKTMLNVPHIENYGDEMQIIFSPYTYYTTFQGYHFFYGLEILSVKDGAITAFCKGYVLVEYYSGRIVCLSGNTKSLMNELTSVYKKHGHDVFVKTIESQQKLNEHTSELEILAVKYTPKTKPVKVNEIGNWKANPDFSKTDRVFYSEYKKIIEFSNMVVTIPGFFAEFHDEYTLIERVNEGTHWDPNFVDREVVKSDVLVVKFDGGEYKFCLHGISDEIKADILAAYSLSVEIAINEANAPELSEITVNNDGELIAGEVAAIEPDIYEHTPLIPELVAETITDDPCEVKYLTNKACRLFKVNEHFRNRMVLNDCREYLTKFMKHWLKALKCPRSFLPDNPAHDFSACCLPVKIIEQRRCIPRNEFFRAGDVSPGYSFL